MAADLDAYAFAVYDRHAEYSAGNPLYALVGYADEGMIPIYIKAPTEGIVWPWAPDNSVAVETRKPVSNELAANLQNALDDPRARQKVTDERGRTDLAVDLDIDRGASSALEPHETHFFKLVVDILENSDRSLSIGMQHFLRSVM